MFKTIEIITGVVLCICIGMVVAGSVVFLELSGLPALVFTILVILFIVYGFLFAERRIK